MRLPLPVFFCCAAICLSQAVVGPQDPQPTAPELPRADRILADGLKDKNPDVRKEVVGALSLAGAREPYLSQIHGALEDKDLYVRLAAVASLVDLEKKNAAPGLIKALYDEAPEVSYASAKALWTLGDPTGRAALLSVISGDSKTNSGPINSKKRDMLRMMKTPRTFMMFALSQGAGFVPFPGVGEGVSSLTLLRQDQGASGRSESILLVAHDPSEDVKRALRESLKDKDHAVRASAVHSIAVRDDPSFVADLVPLLDDSKEAVRFRAAAAYVRLTGIQKKQWEDRQKARMNGNSKAAAAKGGKKT
jgi:hypothetical protein